MRKRFIVAALAACALVFAVSASAGTKIQTLANMSNDGPASNGDNEVDIAINPTYPSNLIAGWNDYGDGYGNACGVGWSKDGGRTWHTDWLRGMTPAGGNPTFDYGAGDPSVGFLNDGTAVFACNAWSNTKPTAITGPETWDIALMVASRGASPSSM